MDAAIGNTRWDAEMLQVARHAFAINPTQDFEQYASQNSWSIYFPAYAKNQ